MNYLPKNRLRYPYFKRILILIAIFILGAFTFSFFDATIISIASPVWKAENVIVRSLRNTVSYFNSQKALMEENAMLKDKLSSLEAEITYLSTRQAQENVLLALMNQRQEANMVVAAVLTRPPQTPYDTIIIGVGSNKSVILGSEVSLPEGPVMGTVSEVFSKRAKVKLFSSNGIETSAILERDNIPVLLEGRGGGNFKFTLPRDIRVEKGDKILSADTSSRLLAVVEEISIGSTDSFQEILAISPINIFILRFVFVMP